MSHRSRWELMRKGCEDYEYLWLLNERLKGLSAEQQNGALAKEARELLEQPTRLLAGRRMLRLRRKTASRTLKATWSRIQSTQRVGDLIEQLSSNKAIPTAWASNNRSRGVLDTEEL